MIEVALSAPTVRSPRGADWSEHAARCRAFLDATGPNPLRVWVSDPDPVRFLAAAFAGLARGDHVFLANPRWSTQERNTGVRIAEPKVFFGGGDPEQRELETGDGPLFANARLMIPTGGSSGRVRFAIHTLDTLFATAEGLRRHFNAGQLSSVCILPVHHIGGFQQAIRAVATGGQLLCADWKAVEGGSYPEVDAGWMLSVVPAQLHRMLAAPASHRWLRRFRAVFVGGAPAGDRLLDEAREARIPVSIAYGSTETGAQVAALLPGEFLDGATGCGRELPHATIRVVDLETGLERSPGEAGRIVIKSAALFGGYWPNPQHVPVLQTEDIGMLDDFGRLTVLGRADAVINSGGEKIHPAEVEAAIRAAGVLSDVCIAGVPDAQWGEVVAALYPADCKADFISLEATLRASLSAHKIPRRWIPVEDWPVNEAGKVNRARLREWLRRSHA